MNHHRPVVTAIRILGVAVVLSTAAFSALSAQAPKPPSPPLPAPNPAAPMYQQKGEQYRAYNFPETGESIPYRLFVPSRWTPGAKLPLLVTLRAGNTIDGPYRAGNDLVKQAEQRGYIVVTPMGYRPLSQPYYGSPYPVIRPAGPSTPRAASSSTPRKSTAAPSASAAISASTSRPDRKVSR